MSFEDFMNPPEFDETEDVNVGEPHNDPSNIVHQTKHYTFGLRVPDTGALYNFDFTKRWSDEEMNKILDKIVSNQQDVNDAFLRASSECQQFYWDDDFTLEEIFDEEQIKEIKENEPDCDLIFGFTILKPNVNVCKIYTKLHTGYLLLAVGILHLSDCYWKVITGGDAQ